LKESVQAIVKDDLISQGFTPKAAQKREPQIDADPPEFLSKIWFSEGAKVARTQIKILRVNGMPEPEIYSTASFPPLRVSKEVGDPPDPWTWMLKPGKYGLTVGSSSKEFAVYAALPQELSA
jgi:hypothetical protein